ncbi:MAG: trypsin-like peptidase domain-containing protein [Bacteroidetes bacterium]|nr:trypsin-like peptidase domain-containing protein [Bacteroidota bacterium]
MSTDNNIWQLAEAYVSGNMPDADEASLRSRLATDPVFAAEFNECLNMLRSLEGFGAYSRFRNMLSDVRQQNEVKAKAGRTISLRSHYWRTASVAAGIALLTTFSTFWLLHRNDKHAASGYDGLKRRLDQIERSQNSIILDIKNKDKKDAPAPPSAPAAYAGTGFALTNDGYLITDYHVVSGADSVYIQNHEGRYFKTYVVDFDANTDLALLKVEKSSFRFSKTDVPYTFAGTKSAVGSRVYTLGFPGDDIVYGEGYISSRNGFQGDTTQYRLEIPAHHGESGGPVIDGSGNLVAVIAGQSEGTTYAVSSAAVLQLIKKLDKDVNIHLPKVNKLGKLSREEQIEKLQAYTCTVKVYKK